MTEEPISEKNFLIYAARHYDNRQCCSTEEFLEDMKRVKYVKKLITRYVETGVLKERLILNHLTVLRNVFGPHVCKMLYVKMPSQMQYVKPFLVMLHSMPSKLRYVCGYTELDMDLVPMDAGIVGALRALGRA